MKQPKFTPDQADPQWRKLVNDIRRVWQAIGPDCEQACEEYGEPMTDEHRIEACLDADHLTLTIDGAQDSQDFYNQITKTFDYQQVDKVLEKACCL